MRVRIKKESARISYESESEHYLIDKRERHKINGKLINKEQ
jgi:hypothetical protein